MFRNKLVLQIVAIFLLLAFQTILAAEDCDSSRKVVFVQKYHLRDDDHKIKHYYAQESVGIATGLLITALHHAGLATLTHTPSPMGFLNKILKRP